MALLEVKDLSLGYDGKAIVEHLNFKVNAGSYLCIVGENGSGKCLCYPCLHFRHTIASTTH